MKRTDRLTMTCAMLGFLILILDSETALIGASEGIELCLRTVVPSLFPFFIFSSLFIGAGSGFQLPNWLTRLLRIPPNCENLLLAGLLGGYPVGARCVAQAWRDGRLQRKDAERMLSFCNNAGPAFLFGMLSSMFPEKWMVWALWGIHIGSSCIAGMLLPGTPSPGVAGKGRAVSLTDAMHSATRAMAGVCGWVVLFRVVLAFLEQWLLWIFPVWAQVFLSGLMELANGCCRLPQITNISVRLVLCSGMLSFGGICVGMQTRSVTAGLGLKLYWKGKLLSGAISILLTCGLVAAAGAESFAMLLPLASGMLCASVLLAHFIRKGQKKNSILKSAVV